MIANWMNELLSIPAEFWAVLTDMAPYLLLGFLVAGALSVLIRPETIERHLGRGRTAPVLKASAFGVPLPLCSCGVIPVSASLRRHGASRAAVTAFLMSTPQTGVDSILVTLSLLGGVFAVYRPIAALVAGFVGGMLVSFFGEGAREAGAEPSPVCTDECCDPYAREHKGRLRRALVYGFDTLPRDIGPSLLIGLLVAALISVLVPENFFVEYLGGHYYLTLGALMLLGLPVYVCATASIPVAAMLVLQAGATPGAAFAFLVTGPATNAATIATMWKVLGRRSTLIYLGTIAATAFFGGMLLDQLITADAIRAEHAHAMMPALVGHASAVVLLIVLAVAVVRGIPRKEVEEMVADADGAPTTRLRVTGMTCSHCAGAVRRALLECEGVDSAEVNLASGLATLRGEPEDYNAMTSAVEELGYGVESVDDADEAA